MFGSSADLDMWLRIAQSHPVGILPIPLMRYRISESQWSAKVRLQTDRADFFRVIDYYIKQNKVRALLTSCDLKNYIRLERRDNIMRAINFFLVGDVKGSRKLLNSFNIIDAFQAALKTKRGLGVLLAWSYLQILFLFRLNEFGQMTLRFLKRLKRK
jgi:hypothetical protein